jgi:hypothetical protein
MNNELMIINEYGEKIGLSMLTKENVHNTDNESLQDLAVLSKLLKQRLKFVDDELKVRLEDGQHFSRVKLVDSTKRTMPSDNDELKQYFVGKYGYGAVELKSNKKLKDKYGEIIQSDLDNNTIEEQSQRVKWD